MTRSGRRLLGLWLTGAALAWLLVLGYSDYLARPAPERALSLNRAQPEALVATALDALAAGALDDAESAARRALAASPFEGRALRVLGAVTELRGNRESAKALMQLAASTTPRDSAAQFWLALNALADKDMDDALRRLDRLLRFEPETASAILPILKVIALNPVGAGPVAAYLADDPPWRYVFMTRVVGEAGKVAEITRLFRAVEAAGGKVASTELDLLAGRLLALRDWPRLRRLLAQMAPETPAAGLHDGGFDGSGYGPLLGWSVGKVAGVDVTLAAPVEGGNRALQLVFYDRRVPFRHVSQVLLLPPGRYQLSGRARLQDLRAAIGLGWNLSCVGSDAALGASERMLGSRDWREFRFAFVVPEENCGGQLLQLVLSARIAAERQVAGKAWFDDLKVESLAPAAATGEVIGSAEGSADET